MISNLLSSINENIQKYLDDLVFINTGITKNIIPIIGTNPFMGINLICNSLIYGFLLYYAISYLLSHITYTQIEKPFQFIFKLLLCAIALNFSEFLCTSVISLFSTISKIILDLYTPQSFSGVSFSAFLDNIIPADYFTTNSFNLFNFDGILKSTISFGFLSLAVSYAVRYILLKVLVIISPFAILSLCSNKTASFFKSWFKSFLALLFLQVLVSIILVVCFVIDKSDPLLLPSQLLHLGMIYSLFKANSFVKEFIGGLSTDVNLSLPNLATMLKGGSSK